MSVLHVDIVVPVRNEEHDLAPSIRRLVGYLRESFPFTARITIADNGSTEEQAGRGRVLRAIWSVSEAEVLAYMDVDLSTDLNALLPQGSSAIAAWVAAHFKKETVGGETVYDLTQPVSGTA